MKILQNTIMLQEKLNVEFNNDELLQTAITHSSFANEKHMPFNERLEFLGDAVLEVVISEYLFQKHKEESEGYLTRIRSLIVCENSLHQIAKRWGLGDFIYMSKGEELTGGRERASILADAVEAIIAAVYLDKGLEFTKSFILSNFSNVIEKAVKNQIILDYKTRLQENLQKNGEVSIAYELTKFEGPPHRRKFYIDLIINGEFSGSGHGYSKKEAEQMAAKEVLLNRGEIDEQ